MCSIRNLKEDGNGQSFQEIRGQWSSQSVRQCDRLSGHRFARIAGDLTHLITDVVGIAEFSHVIAGSVEVFALGWAGDKRWMDVIGGYVLPTLIENVVGGLTLVTALNHAQVVAGEKGEDI